MICEENIRDNDDDHGSRVFHRSVFPRENGALDLCGRMRCDCAHVLWRTIGQAAFSLPVDNQVFACHEDGEELWNDCHYGKGNGGP